MLLLLNNNVIQLLHVRKIGSTVLENSLKKVRKHVILLRPLQDKLIKLLQNTGKRNLGLL